MCCRTVIVDETKWMWMRLSPLSQALQKDVPHRSSPNTVSRKIPVPGTLFPAIPYRYLLFSLKLCCNYNERTGRLVTDSSWAPSTGILSLYTVGTHVPVLVTILNIQLFNCTGFYRNAQQRHCCELWSGCSGSFCMIFVRINGSRIQV